MTPCRGKVEGVETGKGVKVTLSVGKPTIVAEDVGVVVFNGFGDEEYLGVFVGIMLALMVVVGIGVIKVGDGWGVCIEGVGIKEFVGFNVGVSIGAAVILGEGDIVGVGEVLGVG